MATYTRQEVTTTRVEFVVPAAAPWGACFSEVQKAVVVAIHELRDAGRLEQCKSPYYDAIRFRPTGDAIVVYYELEMLS